MVWQQLEIEKAHVAYACVGIFSTIFSLVSLFVKEKLYIGEATVATIAGLILGPHCLNWFNPLEWGDTEYITLEICRIVLCIQIVAVAVELPRKYMKKHWLSVAIFLLPVMTVGWLVVGLFVWALIPHFKFADALLISACVTATDPILAAAVVGKGKFAERVPGHLRNLLSAESGCNDGMAFPFIYLSLNLIKHSGHAGEIIKDWVLYTILWECCFGCVLGIVIGLLLRRAVKFAENKNLIDRESFLAIFVFIAFNSAGIGSMLGVDDLLVSFAAGTAFGWNGEFANKTEESHVSTVIDLLLNLAFFVYFGAIVPWSAFNMGHLGLDVWRLIVLAIVIIFLRRIPAILALKPVTPDVKSWREALFCGHFGPVGVGAIFASILARKELEEFVHEHFTLNDSVLDGHPHEQLIATVWPLISFIVITSIIVHGSSVAVLTLGKRLNRMAITMSFTVTNTQDQGPTWMSRLHKLDKVSTSFSLHDMDTATEVDAPLSRSNTVETSGLKVRPAGGAKRKNRKKREDRPQEQVLQLGREKVDDDSLEKKASSDSDREEKEEATPSNHGHIIVLPKEPHNADIPTTAYQDGSQIVIEDQHGEIIETLNTKEGTVDQMADHLQDSVADTKSERSVGSFESLRRKMSQYSESSDKAKHERRAYHKKSDRNKKVYAHQCDNMIYIENEEGEVIRRYRVNRHTRDVRPRSSSIVDKALSLVGIKKDVSPPPDMEGQPEVISPHGNGQVDEKTSSRIERKLASMLSPGAADREVLNIGEPGVHSGDTQTRVLDLETEVERERRMAALGRSGRDEDDEEEQ